MDFFEEYSIFIYQIALIFQQALIMHLFLELMHPIIEMPFI